MSEITVHRGDEPQPVETYVVELAAERAYFGVMTGHYGAEGWRGNVGLFGNPILGGPSIETIVGRQLGTGTRVRVTVEVIDEQPVTVNPWHAPDRTGHLRCCQDGAAS